MTTALKSEIEIICAGDRVTLRGDGTALIPDRDALLVADLHLGKASSFMAAGIAVPAGIDDSTLAMLSDSIESANVSKVLILGDLIHNRDSMTDRLSEQFAIWRQRHALIEVTLVRGNHDRHIVQFPKSWQLIEETALQVGPFKLIHEVPEVKPIEKTENAAGTATPFQIGGHWHPVTSVGRGADRMRLPCFVVGPNHITLPAFGPFKGGMNQHRTPSKICYPICDGLVWRAS